MFRVGVSHVLIFYKFPSKSLKSLVLDKKVEDKEKLLPSHYCVQF